MKLENVPQRLQDAFLATEDSRFYDHHSLDPVGIARAIFVAVNNGGASQGASTITQQLAQLARDAVAPYAKAGKVRFYQSGAEVVPGMRSHPSPGHTPGHNGIEFTSKGQTMLVWGDLMHNHILQMLDPEIAIEFDSDPKQARASRQAALKDAATRKIWIAGAHMPFPGIGHIRAESNGSYTWVPVEYTPIEIDGKVQ